MFKKNQIVKTLFFVPGTPVGIPADSYVTVVKVMKGGTQGRDRVQVATSRGHLFWVDTDLIAPLCMY
jgi:hypothetical protein